MNRIVTSCLAALALTSACGDDSSTSDATSTTDTSTTTDTATATDTTSGGDTSGAASSALTGVDKPANPKAEPTPNAACATTEANPDYDPTGAFTYPWEGATVNGTAYTCNGCKSGDPKIQGKWRVHGFENPDGTGDADYDFPDPETDYAETLFVDGNSFEVHLKDAKAPSGQQEARYRGFYFCSEMPEATAPHLYWIVTEVDLGSDQPGDVFESDVIQPGGSDNNLIYWYNEVGGTQNKDFQYCKIGTVNPDNSEQTCTNPFE